MSTVGVVGTWHGDEGWGVIDSPATPGGCWTHFSAVLGEGYRTLSPGQRVTFEFETADQDGYRYRTVEAWPSDEPKPAVVEVSGPAAAYASTLTLTFDQPGPSDHR
ncbi:cold-shock protein [Nocardioides plantarum]|uniref:Cold-shock protein n=1 Tax=Nocardioides plantarum TaxID=29299 RepID=A0ABV5KEA1_9ACTN|nr:cold shock domain-containing protein [Nocardioides plantarum]